MDERDFCAASARTDLVLYIAAHSRSPPQRQNGPFRASPSIMSQQDGGESCEELLNLLHQRLISTGEWSSLLSQVRSMLEESGWDAQLRQHAERTHINTYVRRGLCAGVTASHIIC